MGLHVRPVSITDLNALASLVTRANATYASWAGAGWEEPGPERERLHWQERLEDGAAWSGVAERAGELVGCASFTDARADDGEGRPIAGLAHLSRMFVAPDRWRQGIGSALLLRATEEMRRCDYDQAQLFTAGLNVGSRSFYERHGWVLSGETREWQGLCLVHYTLDLTESAP